MTKVAYAYATHEGAVRQVNEDNLCIVPDAGIFAVADGMGGHRGGRIASRITVDNLSEYMQKGQGLISAVKTIHHDILRSAAADPGLTGMGSTVVAMKTESGRYEITWVGDSRAYFWDGTSLKRLTRDHSYVQYLLDEGYITPEEIPDHPQRNIILQALGAQDMEEVAPDMISGIFRENEMILLCSDGLTTEVSESRIAEILARETTLQGAADRLVEAAIAGGGSDNITVILVSARENAGPADDWPDDTEIIDISDATTVIDDSEQTEVDISGVPEDADKTRINEEGEDRNQTSPETRGKEPMSAGRVPSAVQGASTLKIVCAILAALAVLLAVIMGLVRLS